MCWFVVNANNMAAVRADHHSILWHLSSGHKNVNSNNNADCTISITNPGYTNHVTKLVPLTIVIPNFFNNIDQYHNHLDVFLDPPIDAMTDVGRIAKVDTVPVPIDVPVGNYTLPDLVAKINTELAFINIVLAYDDTKKRISFKNNNTHSVSVTTAAPSVHNLLNVLGIDKTLVIPASGILFAPNTPRMAHNHLVFIHSHRLAQAHGVSVVNKNLVDCVSMVNIPHGTAALKECKTDMYATDIEFHTDTERLQTIDFFLTDQWMRRLELPDNVHWHIVFKCYSRGP